MNDLVRRPATGLSRSGSASALRPQLLRELLAFVLDGESYALPLYAIREILKVPPVTEVPRASADVLGIIGVRGRITTLLDMRRLLRVAEAPISKASRVLLVDDGVEVLGLLVDQVLQVHRLQDDEIELAAAFAGNVSEHVLGIGRPRASRSVSREGRESVDPNDILILLDPAHLLRRER
ncbi:MAG: chemotaxis protein CheW [Myxococcota bacterium]